MVMYIGHGLEQKQKRKGSSQVETLEGVGITEMLLTSTPLSRWNPKVSLSLSTKTESNTSPTWHLALHLISSAECGDKNTGHWNSKNSKVHSLPRICFQTLFFPCILSEATILILMSHPSLQKGLCSLLHTAPPLILWDILYASVWPCTLSLRCF